MTVETVNPADTDPIVYALDHQQVQDVDLAHEMATAEDEVRRIDDRGLWMGPGHVAPATIARAWNEAYAENAARLIHAARYDSDQTEATLEAAILANNVAAGWV